MPLPREVLETFENARLHYAYAYVYASVIS